MKITLYEEEDMKVERSDENYTILFEGEEYTINKREFDGITEHWLGKNEYLQSFVDRLKQANHLLASKVTKDGKPSLLTLIIRRGVLQARNRELQDFRDL